MPHETEPNEPQLQSSNPFEDIEAIDAYKQHAKYGEMPDYVGNPFEELPGVAAAVVKEAQRTTSELSITAEHEIGQEDFAQIRFGRLSKVWQKAKGGFNFMHDYMRIEIDDDYRMGLIQSMAAKAAANTSIFWKGKEISYDERDNPVVARALKRAKSRSLGKSEWAMAAAYEIVTMPVVRAIGAEALKGITGKLIKGKAEPAPLLAYAHAKTGNWLDDYDRGRHNPVFRKKIDYHNQKRIVRSPWRR